MKKKLVVIIMREHLVDLKICCNVCPPTAKKRAAEIEAQCPSTGIRSQWKLDFSQKPVRCAEIKGNWHYSLTC